jgi:hypothetical protein
MPTFFYPVSAPLSDFLIQRSFFLLSSGVSVYCVDISLIWILTTLIFVVYTLLIHSIISKGKFDSN